MSGHIVHLRLSRQEAFELINVLGTYGALPDIQKQIALAIEEATHPEPPVHHPGKTTVEDFTVDLHISELRDGHLDDQAPD